MGAFLVVGAQRRKPGPDLAISFYVVSGEPNIRFRRPDEGGPLIFHVDSSQIERSGVAERAASLRLSCMVSRKQPIRLIPAPDARGASSAANEVFLQMDLALSQPVSRVRILAHCHVEYIDGVGIRLVSDGNGADSEMNSRLLRASSREDEEDGSSHSPVTLLDVRDVRERTITTSVPLARSELRPARFASPERRCAEGGDDAVVPVAEDRTHRRHRRTSLANENEAHTRANAPNRANHTFGNDDNHSSGNACALPDQTDANPTVTAAPTSRRIVFAPIVILVEQDVEGAPDMHAAEEKSRHDDGSGTTNAATSAHTAPLREADRVEHSVFLTDPPQSTCVGEKDTDRAGEAGECAHGAEAPCRSRTSCVLYTFLDCTTTRTCGTGSVLSPAGGTAEDAHGNCAGAAAQAGEAEETMRSGSATTSEAAARGSPIHSGHREPLRCAADSAVAADVAFSVSTQLLQIGTKVFELEDIFDTGANEDNDDDGGDAESEEDVCVICLTNKNDTTILPCKHMCVCYECAAQLQMNTNNCPICRTSIRQIITC